MDLIEHTGRQAQGGTPVKKQYIAFTDLDAIQAMGKGGPFRLDYIQTSPDYWFGNYRNLASFQDEETLTAAVEQLKETHTGMTLLAYYRAHPDLPSNPMYRKDI